jgi:hypothetical protein
MNYDETKTTQELQTLMRDIEARLAGKSLILAICDDATGECAAAIGGSAVLLSYLLTSLMVVLENGSKETDAEDMVGNAPSVRTIQ